MRSALPNDTVIKWAKAKVHVYSDSVLCGKDVRMYRSECKNRKHQFLDFISPTLTENYLESMENRSSSSGIFSRTLQHWRSFKRCTNIWTELCEVRIIFMSISNDIDCTKENSKVCLSNSEKVKNYAKRFQRRQWSFFGRRDEEKWFGTHTCTPEGQWNATADDMVARGMGSLRHATNRRLWTREGPGLACMLSLFHPQNGTRREGRVN